MLQRMHQLLPGLFSWEPKSNIPPALGCRVAAGDAAAVWQKLLPLSLTHTRDKMGFFFCSPEPSLPPSPPPPTCLSGFPGAAARLLWPYHRRSASARRGAAARRGVKGVCGVGGRKPLVSVSAFVLLLWRIRDAQSRDSSQTLIVLRCLMLSGFGSKSLQA